MRKLLAALGVALIVLSPMADARPGGGNSYGSRGSRTYTAPPPTRTSPYGAQPMQRSYTPANGPYTGQPGGYGTPRYGFTQRHPFATGFLGGMLGAGLIGMLGGHGFFWGMHSFMSLIGFLFQALLIAAIILWLVRRFGSGRRSSPVMNAPQPMNPSMNGNTLAITSNDYQSFQRLLLDIQAAWSSQNMRAISSMTTPEMAGYFSEQLADLASRGARNIVSGVTFIQGDLSEAWREGTLDYATVAMRYSLIDVTTNMTGQVIDGSSTERVIVTELWTFLRAQGRGNWVLSAIQQTR